MIIQDDGELDMTLNFRIDNFEYVIFVTTAKSKCFGCGRTGHLIRNCPDKVSDREANAVNGNTKGDGGADGVADIVEEVLPGPSSAVAVTAAGVPGESVVVSTRRRYTPLHFERLVLRIYRAWHRFLKINVMNK